MENDDLKLWNKSRGGQLSLNNTMQLLFMRIFILNVLRFWGENRRE
jgi:hypothetical protein